MKKVAMSLLGFAFAFMATHASADFIEDLGAIPQSDLDPFETVVFPHLVGRDVFDDTWTFSLSREGLVSVSAQSILNEDNGVVFLDIEDLAGTLLDSSGALANFTVDAGTGTLMLGPGDYTIQIAGTGTGFVGGAFLGAITVITDASAVPIPAAGLLFFSGIAALGLVRSKRAST